MIVALLVAGSGLALASGQEDASAASTAPAAAASGAGGYQEAPLLAERVAAGELPPVNERLPESPLVLTLERSAAPDGLLGELKIGQYGGTVRLVNLAESELVASVARAYPESVVEGESFLFTAWLEPPLPEDLPRPYMCVGGYIHITIRDTEQGSIYAWWREVRGGRSEYSHRHRVANTAEVSTDRSVTISIAGYDRGYCGTRNLALRDGGRGTTWSTSRDRLRCRSSTAKLAVNRRLL